MELWWIILAGCGGGLLLLAYVAVVVYKIFRHKKRVQMNQYPDPERLTDDKDWTVHVKASEVSERRVDGLCMDTISGSTKLRRKASIPFDSQIPGGLEEFPQSVLKQEVPVVSPQTNAADKQHPRPEPQASASKSRSEKEAKPNVATAAPRNSPEVVRRSEYTWETLLRQPSDARKKRSRSFNWDDSDYRKANSTTRSLKFHKEGQGKRFVRSKSLRGYTQRELAILSADGTVPLNKMVISVEREDEPTKRNKSKKSPKAHRTVTDARKEVKKAEATKRKTNISRSGSAPSLRAKERLIKNEAEGPPRRRNNSFRWIPEPDYQAVLIEELVAATSRQNKATNENVCVVEIHNVPRDRDPKVSTSTGTDTQAVDGFPSSSIQQASPSYEEPTKVSTTVDVETVLPVPGIARRVPTILNDQRPDKNEATQISINTRERKLSVKNHVQNLETQIADTEPYSRNFQATTSQRNYTVDTAAPTATDINNNYKTLPNWGQKQSASGVREEPNINNNSQTGQPSFKTKPEVRSIGKMTITKHVETPPRWKNPEVTTKNPIREDTSKSFDRASSTQTRQLTETTLARNTTVLLRRAEEQRQSETSYAPNVVAPTPPPPPPPPPVTVNPVSSSRTMGNDVKITISPKDNQDAGSEKSKEPSVPRAKEADINATLEEKKKMWKREQLVDQLHNARARNANQNYIFGTGLAYQSCMPELQNKLKQLALAK